MAAGTRACALARESEDTLGRGSEPSPLSVLPAASVACGLQCPLPLRGTRTCAWAAPMGLSMCWALFCLLTVLCKCLEY